MSPGNKISVAALGAAITTSALLTTGAGVALAQDAPPPEPCRPNSYPPEQCRVVGGSGFDAPPVVVDKTIAPPGATVSMAVQSGCLPGSDVVLALLHLRNGAVPVGLKVVKANAAGGYDTSVVLPSAAEPGVYVLYSECTTESGDTVVSTTSFVVVPAQTSSAGLRTSGAGSSGSSAGGAAATEQAAADAVVETQALPATWSAPASWTASGATKKAVAEAVNVRLAVMRAALPSSSAAAAAPASSASSPTDVALWGAAAGGVVFLAVGALVWRRRSSSDLNEVNA